MSEALVVAAGCHGVGTSFVAGVAALAASRQGRSVLLVDAVMTGAAQHALFGLEPRVNLWDLADRGLHAADVAIPIEALLTLIPGAAPDTTPCPSNDARRRLALGRLADAYAHIDLIVIDAGSMLDSVRAATETFDADLLIVTAGDRVTLASSHALAKAVRLADAGRPITVAANRDPRGLESCEHLNTAAARFLGAPLLVGGSIPDDRSVRAALGAGITLIDAADDSIASIAVTGVLAARAPRRTYSATGTDHAAPLSALSRSRS